MTYCEPMPAILFEPAPCGGCGARTEAEAGNICRPTTDETGERSCPGEFNDTGISIRPTAESLAEMDAWIEKHYDCGMECRVVGEVSGGRDE